MEFQRDFVETIISRVQEGRSFVQIVMGPRQTGKSTAVSQALAALALPQVIRSFSNASTNNVRVLEEAWAEARDMAESHGNVVLSLDEVQLVPDWSSRVKMNWDDDTAKDLDVRVILTGSSSLLIRQGLSESLMGRFEIIRSTHWNYWECMQAFDYELEDFLYFGGYPGAAKLRLDEERWYDYMRDSIIDPTLNIDVLEMEDIRKPALMRALFELGAAFSAQELSYRKILGQLDDKGNTITIASYLDHLSLAGLLSGLHKYSNKILKTRNSSPRFLVHDTSLMVAASGEERRVLLSDPERRGHLVETAVGAYLLARSHKEHFDLLWWRENNKEVDFVIKKGNKRTAIEVKSGRPKGRGGLAAFIDQYPGTYAFTVGSEEISLEGFLLGRHPLFQ